MNYILILVLTAGFYLSSSCTAVGSNTTVASTEPVANVPVAIPANDPPSGGTTECKICNFEFSAYKGELSKEEIQGLLLALNDEYLATATYEQVNRDLNDPRPFVNIVEAERRHAERLKALFTKYGVAIPDNPWPGNVQKFSSVTEACKASVEGELLNRDLYTRLFKTTQRPDIVATYKDLQRASEENHLPAFERCSSGGGGRGPANGTGNGRGRRGN